MAASLTDVLEALGELFLVPGAFPKETFADVMDTPWAGASLREGVAEMLAAGGDDLPVAYAGTFLIASGRPTLHLEASAFRTGRLRDEGVLGGLEPLYGSAEVHPAVGIPEDHLGSLLLLMAQFLRLIAAGRGNMEGPARQLLAEPLGPFADAVAGALRVQGIPPFYAGAGAALGGAMDACRALLA